MDYPRTVLQQRLHAIGKGPFSRYSKELKVPYRFPLDTPDKLETDRFRYAGMSDLTASLRDYITFYNEKRPHTTIGNLTPIQAER